jgi:hypothetical protein
MACFGANLVALFAHNVDKLPFESFFLLKEIIL